MYRRRSTRPKVVVVDTRLLRRKSNDTVGDDNFVLYILRDLNYNINGIINLKTYNEDAKLLVNF